MLAAATMTYAHSMAPDSLALTQLSEADRKLVARLKSLYPSHVLGSVFQDSDVPTSQSQPCTDAAGSSRDSTSSTLYMTSVDGDTCCASTSSRSSNNSLAEKTPLWKKRAASVPKISSSTTASIKALSRPRSRRGQSESKVKQKAVQPLQLASIDAVTALPAPATPAVSVHALYFCTTCEESFQERSEWQDHEYSTHEQQFFWFCSNSGCDQVFTKADDFAEHYQSQHGQPISTYELENKRPLPSKRSWACGFDRCKGVFNNWEERCDHVAEHFESLAKLDDATQQPSEWKYTNVLRNLLRQPDIKEAYKRMMVKLHGNDKVVWPKMRWQADNSSELLRKLEYRDFREGFMEIARVACQLGHPASYNAECVRIAVQETEDLSMASSVLYQNESFLHIDKFPTPGQNPFELYGPVPPSPIIQLDFSKEDTFVEAPPEYTSSRKSSLATNPYSLYPSPVIENPHLAQSKVQSPSPLASSSTEIHALTSPTDAYSFQTATTWATAYSNAGDASPPRPKTPSSVFRAAKSLLKKRSHSKLSRPSSAEEKFDSAAAQQTIASYQAR